MVDGKTPAVFFDRDGTIMHDANYCSDPKDVHVFPFVAESLRRLKAAGFKLIMATNQSGIGRGYFTPSNMTQCTPKCFGKSVNRLLTPPIFALMSPALSPNVASRRPEWFCKVQGKITLTWHPRFCR
jgi:HAD-superfamily hydrolase, subfamily IIIA